MGRRCADVRLNGFPLDGVAARDANGPSFAPPVNPYMAGPRNLVEVVLGVSGFDGKPLPFTRKRDLPLLRSLPGAEGERTELTAFVAPRAGGLRLVR